MGSKQKYSKDTKTQNFIFQSNARYGKNGLEDWMQCICLITQNAGAHASHIILHMLHLTTKPYSLSNRETTHINTCWSPSHFLPSKPLLPWLSSHAMALWCEMGYWGTRNENNLLSTLCLKQFQKHEYHTLIWCSTFDHARFGFPHRSSPFPTHIILIVIICKLNCRVD